MKLDLATLRATSNGQLFLTTSLVFSTLAIIWKLNRVARFSAASSTSAYDEEDLRDDDGPPKRLAATPHSCVDADRADAGEFRVFVAVDRFKFSAAHFIAYKGFRERLHGHNYSVSVRLVGSSKIGDDGYVLDFGHVKTVVVKICKELNEHFLMPELSDVIVASRNEKSLSLICEDGAKFVFPISDVSFLPLRHSSAEELAQYIWTKIVQEFTLTHLRERGIQELEVSVAELPAQQATFRKSLYSSTLTPDGRPRRGSSDFFRRPTPCAASHESTEWS